MEQLNERLTKRSNKLLLIVVGIFIFIIIGMAFFSDLIIHNSSIIYRVIAVGILVTAEASALILYIRNKKSTVVHRILSLGVGLFSAIYIIKVSMAVYPIAILYIFLVSIFADKKMSIFHNACFLLVGIIKMISLQNSNASIEVINQCSLMIIVICLLGSISYIVNRNFENLLNNITTNLTEIEEKNKRDKEITNTILDVAKNVSINTGDISTICEQISSSTTAVTTAISEIASGATQTAHDVGSQTEDTENIKTRVEECVNGCSDMYENIKLTMSVINDGNDVVESLLNESNHVSKNSEEVSKLMDELLRECDKISNITNAISQIAEQTNLLALNASIEAARAGDAGRGFGVVASEIGNLADKSKESTSSISKIIDELQEKVNKSVKVVNTLISSTDVQGKLIDKTSKIFTSIDENTSNNEKNTKTIKNEIGEILKAIENISDAAIRLSNVSEETMANSEETLAMSNEHIEQAKRSLELVKNLENELSRLEEYITV